MISIRDLGDTIELAVLLPVIQKPLSDNTSKTGYNYADLKSHGFIVKLSTRDYVNFVESVMDSFTAFQFARAEVFKTQVDETPLH